MTARRSTVDLMLSIIRLLQSEEHSVASLAKAVGARHHVIAPHVQHLLVHELIEPVKRHRLADAAAITYRWKKVP